MSAQQKLRWGRASLDRAVFDRRSGESLGIQPRAHRLPSLQGEISFWTHRVDRTRFWQIVDAARKKAKGDQEAQLVALRELLELLFPEQLVEFQEVFDDSWIRAYRWAVSGSASPITH